MSVQLRRLPHGQSAAGTNLAELGSFEVGAEVCDLSGEAKIWRE
jgi:hypothetical protein